MESKAGFFFVVQRIKVYKSPFSLSKALFFTNPVMFLARDNKRFEIMDSSVVSAAT